MHYCSHTVARVQCVAHAADALIIVKSRAHRPDTYQCSHNQEFTSRCVHADHYIKLRLWEYMGRACKYEVQGEPKGDAVGTGEKF